MCLDPISLTAAAAATSAAAAPATVASTATAMALAPTTAATASAATAAQLGLTGAGLSSSILAPLAPAAASGLTTMMPLLSPALQVGALLMSGMSQRADYSANQSIAQHNVVRADAEAQDAILRGEDEMVRHYQRAAQIRGKQEAGLAASGVELASGSPLNILADTETLADIDAQIIAENARRESEALSFNADNYRRQADAYATKKSNSLLSDVIGTGRIVADEWYQTKLGRG